MKLEQSVPKRRHMMLRFRGIAQQKELFRTRRKFEIKKKIICICVLVNGSDFSTTTPVMALISRVRFHYLVNFNFSRFRLISRIKKICQQYHNFCEKRYTSVRLIRQFFVEKLATLLVNVLCNFDNTICKLTLLLCHCDYVYKNYCF